MPVINEKQELAKKADLLTKQDILTPGTGITIQNNVISATGTGGSTVTVSPVLSTGTRVAAMEVDGTLYTLFAPTPPSVSVTQVQSSGTELARVVINGVSTSIYAPLSSTVLSGTSAPSAALGENNNLYVQYTVSGNTYTVDMTYIKLNGEWVELTAGGGGTDCIELTQAQYNALTPAEKSNGTIYFITDDDGTVIAETVIYDNTTSGMTATNVQDALDEVFQSVSDGKELIADAITDKGVPTSATASFATMANNIAAISGGGGNNYVVDPNALDVLGASSGSSMIAPAALIWYSQYGGAPYIATYNNTYMQTMSYYGNKALSYIIKVKKECKTLEIDCAVEDNTSGYYYNNAKIVLSYEDAITSYDGFSNPIQSTYLTDYNGSAADINNQPNVTINSTDPRTLSRQIVILDLEPLNLTNDIAVGLYNCDCYFYVRSIEAKY